MGSQAPITSPLHAGAQRAIALFRRTDSHVTLLLGQLMLNPLFLLGIRKTQILSGTQHKAMHWSA